MKHKTSFKNKVYYVVKRIPKGKVMSYKMVAELAGKPRAWRAVGNILNKNPEGVASRRPYGAGKNPKIPCHRVIRSHGKIGGYNLGIKEKLKRLKKEGVI